MYAIANPSAVTFLHSPSSTWKTNEPWATQTNHKAPKLYFKRTEPQFLIFQHSADRDAAEPVGYCDANEMHHDTAVLNKYVRNSRYELVIPFILDPYLHKLIFQKLCVRYVTPIMIIVLNNISSYRIDSIGWNTIRIFVIAYWDVDIYTEQSSVSYRTSGLHSAYTKKEEESKSIVWKL